MLHLVIFGSSFIKMQNQLSRIVFLMAAILAGVQAMAQDELKMLEFPKEKRVIALEARIGYYWDVGSVSDSIIGPVRDFTKKLMKGPRFGFSVLYNWNDNFDIGLTYSYFNTNAVLPGAQLLYTTTTGVQYQLSGNLNARVEQHFIGLRVDPNFQLGEFFYVKPGITTGFTNYYNYIEIDGLQESLEGNTIGFELHLGFEYFIDPNWSLNLSGSYFAAALHNPEMQSSLDDLSDEEVSGVLFKWHVGLGLRYNFTAIDLKSNVQPKPKRTTPKEKKNRFD